MYTHKKITQLNDFFLERSRREGDFVFFYRINGYTEDISEFIQNYYDAARKSGVIIEGKIPNPDEKNLSFYGEMMGMDFKQDREFISNSLKKWLPRMKDYPRRNVADSIFYLLESLKKSGKTESMIKNAYIKFMCWLYYKFERIVNQLGEETIPKILYEGDISYYELMLISIISNAGCDVVLLQYNGDESYLKTDKESVFSDDLKLPDMKAFPDNYSLKSLREKIKNEVGRARLYGRKPEVTNCTNAWIEGNWMEDIAKSVPLRGNDKRFYYNCFCRVIGVEDKYTYLNDLYQFHQMLIHDKRKVVVVDDVIPKPGAEEIRTIHRGNYANAEQLIMDLSTNIKYTANDLLQRIMVKAFVDVMLEAAEVPGMNVNKLTSRAVYLLCRLKRYQTELFSNWKMPDVSCFIYMGGCRDTDEEIFLKMLARLPVDVLILVPDFAKRCCLTDEHLYEVNYTESFEVGRFPKESAGVSIGTAAYQAERELDTIMYQDSGLYRNRQYEKANIVSLRTMYEEIAILWDEELKYRPSFGVIDDKVTIPVIYSKICGVKENNVQEYWKSIKMLITEDTFVIKQAGFIQNTTSNPIKQYATEFWKEGRLRADRIKENPQYRYSVLREEIQNYMLEKLGVLIRSKIIKGTFVNGTEYTIVSTVLNLPKEILRMIQKFDFTKKNPKLIYILTDESSITLEESIMTAYLNLLGFDIIFFVPTGYQTVEKYFNSMPMEEHQIGDYIYDLNVPDFNRIVAVTDSVSWRERIFGKR